MMARLMGLRTVDPERLRRRLESGPIALFDVNSRGSWLQARIPGARHLDPESFGPGELPVDRGRTLVFYCSNPLCRKAPRAALRARRLGYRDVEVLSAGIRGWLAAGLPTESGEAS
jgi:rhodanese-related sulfurtransferase